MALPLENTGSSFQSQDYKALQPLNHPGEGILSTHIISRDPPKEVVNITTTTSTITDSNGSVKKLKTTTTTTLRTTTTVRRVCLVGPGVSAAVEAATGGNAEVSNSSICFVEPVEDQDNSSNEDEKILSLIKVSEDEETPRQVRNVMQVTFMKPQTQTSEVVEVKTDDKSDGLAEAKSEDASQTRKTTKTVRKRVTTSVAAVFASRRTKVEGKNISRSNENLNQSTSTDFEGEIDRSNDDSAAMTALREFERQFATRLDMAKNRSSDGSTTVIDHYTSDDGKITTKTTTTSRGAVIPSLFDGLPLYQGYGIISQQIKANKSLESPISVFFNGLLDNIDVTAITKMFEEATKTRYLSSDLQSLFGDLPISEKLAIKDSSGNEAKHESDVIGDQVINDVSHRNSGSVIGGTANAVAGDVAEGDRVGYRHQILHQLATQTGPCRIAWSEMPEVLSENIASLSRYEIQLQEAMFEVITSEASYYRSLQVLIDHFYSAPEFDCSRSNVSTTELPGSRAEGYPACTSPQGNETKASAAAAAALSGSIKAGLLPTFAEPIKPIISPTEKHHLFSNVLLVCIASERFLKDLESRWSSQKPLLDEVSDLIVKHAGSVYFDPYLTYLRNQTYQVAAYRRLNRRESFQKALARIHGHPEVGKNHLDSFLALPMQRLTRLKLLVEVIQKLQIRVTTEMEKRVASSSTETMTPSDSEVARTMNITKQQLENTAMALRELKKLLSESESEKQLMEEKARLLALSSALEFPEHVKRIAISDKRLVKEGELKSASSDSKATVLLKKFGRKKPETFYLILFHDFLMITKIKKNDRYMVQDYCSRDKIFVTIGNPIQALLNSTASTDLRFQPLLLNNDSGPSGVIKRQKRPSASILGLKGVPRHHTATPKVPEACFSANSEAVSHSSPLSNSSLSSTSSNSSTIGTCGAESPCSSPPYPSRFSSMRLRRSGSSLSSKSAPTGSSYTQSLSSTINRDLPYFLYVYLTESQNGTCTEFCFTTNDSSEYESWYQALDSKSLRKNDAILAVPPKKERGEREEEVNC